MSTTPPIQYSSVKIAENVPWEVRVHLQALYKALGNHTQAFQLQSDKIAKLKAGTTTTVFEGGGGGGGGSITATGVAVNNQSGQTSYSTLSGDNNALIVFSDASPIAVTLNSQTPPWSCFIANIGALGAGTVTLTPFSGTINGGATLAVLPTYFALAAFDGTNWFAATLPIVPVGFGVISHEFLTAYNAATGAFTAAQPAFTDVSGVATTAQIGTGSPAASKYVDGGTGAWTALPAPTLPATIAPVAGEYLTGYDATTGNFSQSTPAGISVTITTAALTGGGTQGSMTFTAGILTAQTPAT